MGKTCPGMQRLSFRAVNTRHRLVTALCVLSLSATACAQQKPAAVRLDFTDARVVSSWQPTHDVSRIEATPAGMRIHISGSDPYIHGPAIDPPQGTALWIRLRLYSDESGMLQVFYFKTHTSEENSRRVAVPAKEWVEVSMPAPPMEPQTRLRIDPPGVSGTCVIAWLEVAPRSVPVLPKWSKPPVPAARNPHLVRSGQLVLRHDRARWGAFDVTISGYRMATGWSQLPIAYETPERFRWFDPAKTGQTRIQPQGSGLQAVCVATDPDGAKWTIRQTIQPAKKPGGVQVTTSITVSRPRSVYFLPVFAVFPGNGSFGTARERGLLAGVEYLDPKDVSSSEADLRGEQAQRLVPDHIKLTFPLMVMQARGRYVALTWEPKPWLTPAYDTPDRSFGSGANAMALLVPGSDGNNRSEGSLMPYLGYEFKANSAYTVRATLYGGTGESVLPAVQRYVSDNGLPPVPPTGMDRAAYARWTAGGWLDSKIRDGARYRHAYWPGVASFGPQPAADVAVWLEWLAVTCNDATLASRLRSEVNAVLDITDPAGRDHMTVSHVTYPVATLLFGDVAGAVEVARQHARAALQRFEPDGTILYKPTGNMDFGATHWEKHANGLTAPVVWNALKNAMYAGDRQLLTEALGRLRALDRYKNSAPRGAQTWEVPLHTPDILASAYLVKAYLLGYELTGEQHFLDMARHWAWTGVPFVYLYPPTSQPVGLYATTPVLGATHWVAPNWIGLPVQWCGLVYSDALYRLARYDNPSLWRKLADGITASGIQQSWPSSDKDLQGLLPDSFTFRTQTRNPVAINPGTVQANAIRLYGGPEVYDYAIFRKAGLTVQAPGRIDDQTDGQTSVAFTVKGWSSRPYYVLINGAGDWSRIAVNGRLVSEGPDLSRVGEHKSIVLQVQGEVRVSLSK